MGETVVPACRTRGASLGPGENPGDALLVEAGRLATIGTLTRTVAHEINNPLLAILGLVEFVRNDLEEGTEPYAFVELIHENGLEIKRVVGTLLDFTREPPHEWGAVSLSRVAAEAVEIARRISPVACAAITEDYATAETRVRGNANQLKHLLLHLVRHGERTMLAGGTLRSATSRESQLVSVVVSYVGPARDATETPPLERAEFEAGLAASHAIARAHGGELRLHERASGREFVLRLPVGDEGA